MEENDVKMFNLKTATFILFYNLFTDVLWILWISIYEYFYS